MIRTLHLIRLKCRAYILHAQMEHAEALMDDHKRRYEICVIELRKVLSRITALEKPEVLLTQALRRAGK